MNPTDELLAEILIRPDDQWHSGLDEICRKHPELADELRRRFAQLELCGVTAPTESRLLPPGEAMPERFGPYRLQRRLGGGGMGVVWLAMHEELGREVAIKMIRPERFWMDHARDRFRREVEAVARLRHSGCVQVHQVGEAEGVPYFAMEFLPGSNCEQLLAVLRAGPLAATPGRLTGAELAAALRTRGAAVESGASELFAGPWVRVAVRIVMAAAEAVAHAHARGVIHRDLKPSNLMVTPEGRVVVIDFGLAVVGGTSPLTREGSLLGSLQYMAPEQIRGDAAAPGKGIDVYGLGVCLYEMLALVPPFAAVDEPRLRHDILTGAPPALRSLNPAVTSDLAVVVTRAMHVDRERRYASAVDLAADLMAILEDRPIRARRDALATRVLRWSRRHPALATALLLIVLGLLLVPTIVTFAIAAQRDRAQTAEHNARRREYAANLAAASAALLAGNGAEARLRLDACPGELRGFEWRHLRLALDGSLAVMTMGDVVTAVAVSPAGDLVAAADRAGRLALFDLPTGQRRRDVLPAGGVPGMALGFGVDGTELFVVDTEQTVRVYRADSGALVRERPRELAHEKVYLADVVDRLVCDRGGGHLVLVDPLTLAMQRAIQLEQPEVPRDGVVMVRGDEAAMARVSGVMVVSTVDGARRGELAADHAGVIRGVSADGQWIAALAGGNDRLLVWHRGAGSERWIELGGRRCRAALFPRGGRYLAALCENGAILVSDASEGTPLRTLQGHRGAVVVGAEVPASASFVTGGEDGTVRLWNCHVSPEQVELRGASEGRALAVASGSRLLLGGDDAVLAAVNAATGSVAFTQPHAHWVNAVAVVAGDDLAISVCGSQLRFWSATTGASRGDLDLPPKAGLPIRMAVAPSGRELALGTRSGCVVLVDIVARTVRRGWRLLDGAVSDLVFDASRRRLLTCGADGRIQALDLDSLGAPREVCRSTPIHAMALWADRLYTSEQAAVGGGGSLCERDAATGAILRSHSVSDVVSAIRVVDATRVAVGTQAGQIMFWDRDLLVPVLSLRAFTQSVTSLASDPAGEWMAATGYGGAPRILRAAAAAPAIVERVQVAEARVHAQAALAETGWPKAAERALRQAPELTASERAAAVALLPPRNRWALATSSYALAASVSAARLREPQLRNLFVALTEAVQDEVDGHGLHTRCSCALVAVRLRQPEVALEVLAPVTLDTTLEPGAEWFSPVIHFARAMAHWQLGHPAEARAARAALAGLVDGAFDRDAQARMFLRELDDVMR